MTTNPKQPCYGDFQESKICKQAKQRPPNTLPCKGKTYTHYDTKHPSCDKPTEVGASVFLVQFVCRKIKCCWQCKSQTHRNKTSVSNPKPCYIYPTSSKHPTEHSETPDTDAQAKQRQSSIVVTGSMVRHKHAPSDSRNMLVRTRLHSGLANLASLGRTKSSPFADWAFRLLHPIKREI